MKLNENQMDALLLIADSCDGDTFFVPGMSGDIRYVNVGKYKDGILKEELKSISIYGSLTASFRTLERMGFIKRPDTTLPQKYIYELTEEGRLAVEEYRSSQ